MKLVMDCSFMISMILPGELSPGIDFSTYQIHVPHIFTVECINAMIMAKKRNRVTQSQYDSAIAELLQSSFNLDTTSSEHFHEIAKLALRYNLTPYDASYIELAKRLGAKLATFDKTLICAAQECGVELLF